VASLVGFVTVVGFVIRNGLLLLNRYRELQADGRSVHEAVIEGSLERMVPILMTSLTTTFGLLPIVLAYNKPGGELLAPLAIVQFGGLISATLLNLLVLPAAYRLAFDRCDGAA
jgi:HME family heavy-metal exporter